MKITSDYNGTIIGIIFTIISLLLTLTYIIPIISVLPGTKIESLMALIIDNDPYSTVVKSTIMVLILLMIAPLLIILLKTKKNQFTNALIISIMSFEYFIIHSIGFYIYWATSLNYKTDGQLIFAAVESFPVSSFGFIGIGIIVDIIKKSKKPDFQSWV